jgi:hypothetical protein
MVSEPFHPEQLTVTEPSLGFVAAAADDTSPLTSPVTPVLCATPPLAFIQAAKTFDEASH